MTAPELLEYRLRVRRDVRQAMLPARPRQIFTPWGMYCITAMILIVLMDILTTQLWIK